LNIKESINNPENEILKAKIFDINGIMNSKEDIKENPVVNNLFYRKNISLLWGEVGCGKTWLILDLCLKLADGKNIWGAFPSVPQKILLLQSNISLPLLKKRLKTMNLCRNKDNFKIIITDELEKENLNYHVNEEKGQSIFEYFIKETKADLIIIDNLECFFNDLNKKFFYDLKFTMNFLKNMSIKYKCHIMNIMETDIQENFPVSYPAIDRLISSLFRVDLSPEKNETIIGEIINIKNDLKKIAGITYSIEENSGEKIEIRYYCKNNWGKKIDTEKFDLKIPLESVREKVKDYSEVSRETKKEKRINYLSHRDCFLYDIPYWNVERLIDFIKPEKITKLKTLISYYVYHIDTDKLVNIFDKEKILILQGLTGKFSCIDVDFKELLRDEDFSEEDIEIFYRNDGLKPHRRYKKKELIRKLTELEFTEEDIENIFEVAVRWEVISMESLEDAKVCFEMEEKDACTPDIDEEIKNLTKYSESPESIKNKKEAKKMLGIKKKEEEDNFPEDKTTVSFNKIVNFGDFNMVSEGSISEIIEEVENISGEFAKFKKNKNIS